MSRQTSILTSISRASRSSSIVLILCIVSRFISIISSVKESSITLLMRSVWGMVNVLSSQLMFQIRERYILNSVISGKENRMIVFRPSILSLTSIFSSTVMGLMSHQTCMNFAFPPSPKSGLTNEYSSPGRVKKSSIVKLFNET